MSPKNQENCTKIFDMTLGKELEGSSCQSYADEPDETVVERLCGLMEMFPQPVRSFCCSMVDKTTRAFQNYYGYALNGAMTAFISGVILVLPVILERNRERAEEETRRERLRRMVVGTQQNNSRDEIDL